MSSFLTIQYFPTEKKKCQNKLFLQEMFSFEATFIYFLNAGEVSHFRRVPKLKVLFYVTVQNASAPKVSSRKMIKITSLLSPRQNPSV